MMWSPGEQDRQEDWTCRPARAALLALVALGAVASLLWTALTGLGDPLIALIFCLFVAGGELARITLPGDREVAPVASAGAISYAFVLSLGQGPLTHSAAEVVAVAVVGLFMGELPHIAVGRGPRLEDAARRLLAVMLIAWTFRPLAENLSLSGLSVTATLLMLVLVTAVWLVDTWLAALLRAERIGTRLWVTVRDEMRAQFAVGGVVGAGAVLIALACSVSGLVGLLVFSAPLLVSHVAFRRYAEIRRTYLETVRALSRVTEVGGYVENGHSRRVSCLSYAIGCEMGFSEAELLSLEYAALMHDIGQLSLSEPIAGGATVLASPLEQRRIAELGSGIIQQTGVLNTVAETVRRQCEPVDGDGGAGAPPVASRIIKVANAFDDLVGAGGGAERRAAVVERLRMDAGTEYDPDVVDALTRILTKD